ncbi:hypothetical protein AGLY_002653 [Aphis glycines]|uniref:Uncharacterized protein n=1 Tax=Aphis glycines TaxID=307491 RepID=A0A6G0U384_APHGL|nr:hypothetical protein AGLY_002653 [Aphis glycines]
MYNKILTEESEFIAKGLGWSLVSIDGLQLRINLVNPLKGKKKSGLNFKCIDFPTPIKQIKKFEQRKNHFDLFLFNNDKTSHYCYIKDFSRFIRSQKTKNCNKDVLQLCKLCKLWGKAGLIKHKQMCDKNELGRPLMFEEGKDDELIYFKSYKKTNRTPFVIYADFECILKPKQTNKFNKSNKKSKISKTYVTHLHEIMIIQKSYCNNLKFQRRGKDSAKKFMENMIDIGRKINNIYETNIPMIPLTEKEEKQYQKTKDMKSIVLKIPKCTKIHKKNVNPSICRCFGGLG